MDTTKEYSSLAMAIRDYFGMRPKDTTAEFIKELGALTPADKAEFVKELTKLGYTIRWERQS